MVITATADLDAAIADLVHSAFGHAGQKCSAASLALVEASVYDGPHFLRRLADAVRSLRVGPATDPGQPGRPADRPARGTPWPGRSPQLDDGEAWLVPPDGHRPRGAHRRPPGLVVPPDRVLRPRPRGRPGGRPRRGDRGPERRPLRPDRRDPQPRPGRDRHLVRPGGGRQRLRQPPHDRRHRRPPALRRLEALERRPHRQGRAAPTTCSASAAGRSPGGPSPERARPRSPRPGPRSSPASTTRRPRGRSQRVPLPAAAPGPAPGRRLGRRGRDRRRPPGRRDDRHAPRGGRRRRPPRPGDRHRPGPLPRPGRPRGVGRRPRRRRARVDDNPVVDHGRVELLRWLREQAISRTRHRYGTVLPD